MALRVVLAQLNATVGDVAGNRRLIQEAIRRAQAWLADVVVVPELAVTGYPPEDLLLKPQFISSNLLVINELARSTRGITALVGFVDRDARGVLHNAAAVLSDGRIAAVYHKQGLPNYGVFDERRYFAPGARPVVFEAGGVRCGVTICEDLWLEGPPRRLAALGAQAVLNLSASPYHAGKLKAREAIFARQARTHRVAIAYCNLVGGQDELVFDGASLVLDARGRRRALAAQFREDTLVVDLEPMDLGRPGRGRTAFRAPARRRPRIAAAVRQPLAPLAEVYEALVLGLRDYVRKNRFSAVVLGLSGGIDSALTACLAADALGPAQVVGLVMPSRYSSRETQRDAKALGAALGIEVREVSIEPLFRAAQETLRPHFAGRAEDVTEQNLQARIRGLITMAFSNKFGWLVLTTGNKSEIATGYCTLYGDMAGGFAVLKDVPKTLVYALARWRNGRGPGGPIPASVIRRVPSAELAPHQTDQDTLPPYPVLDRILKAYVEEDRAVRDILAANRVDPATVRRVAQMVDRAEYKRRQGAPGIKITPRAFGKDRRMPITNRYRQN
jgi:NAD+ synthase (glutamine-hydrolysing)